MTKKQWSKLLIWAKDKVKPVTGVITLYPEAIRFISFSSEYEQKRSSLKQDISIYNNIIKIYEEQIFVINMIQLFNNPKKRKFMVPYKHIKTLRINGFNN